jgi:hypothetical protein
MLELLTGFGVNFRAGCVAIADENRARSPIMPHNVKKVQEQGVCSCAFENIRLRVKKMRKPSGRKPMMS